VAKAALTALVACLGDLPDTLHLDVGRQLVDLLQPRLTSFEEQAAGLREGMAAALERAEDYAGAARALAGINLESGPRAASAHHRLATYVRIAMLFLEDGDAVSAETYTKRASPLVAAVADSPGLELQYKTCYARVLDSKRKFLEAATRYYDLSQAPAALVGEGDRRTALGAAAACAILAGAGPQRSRVLAMLCRDERCAELPTHSLLTKVFLGRLLGRDDVEAFRATLPPHQLATLPDGSTVLDRACSEHNLVAASRLYCNVSFDQLGALLGLSPDRAEAVASRMIREGRLEGTLDQVSGVLVFRTETHLERWDARISALCRRVNAASAAVGGRGE